MSRFSCDFCGSRKGFKNVQEETHMKLVRTWKSLAGAALMLLCFAALPAIAQDATPPASAPAAAAPAAAAPADAAAAPAAATPAPKLDSGDTAWMLTSVALVLMMTIPGLALFYGGMVRKKNVLATLMQSFAITCLITVLWTMVSYSLAFRPGSDAYGAYIGGLDRLFLKGMEIDSISDLAKTIPESVYMCFQMTFAIITPALICGSFADRMKFSAMMWFMAIWSIVVYAPVAHWVWGPGGWLGTLGVLDYAGGTVVHINAGVAGLVTALVLGKRKGYPTEPMPPHNLILTMIGASLLWVGWFGFNAGSAVTSGVNAGMAMAVTQIATAAAGLGWMFVEWIFKGKPSVLGICSGAVAGLVAITPASGFVEPGGALVIGFAAGAVCFWSATSMKHMFGYDDSLDAFGVHAVGGILGAILTGVFARASVIAGASTGVDMSKGGLVDGHPEQILIQLYGIGAVIVFDVVLTYIILKAIDLVIGLRVDEETEIEGLDLALHGEVVP
jgi:Amt family ammonium transporter